MRGLALWLGVLLACTALGCSSRPVVHQRHLIVSTKTSAAPPHEVLGPVATSYCDHLVLVVFPFVHDQRESYGDLLDEVRRMGGDAIVDLQVSLRDTAYFFPVYMKGCWHFEGTAIRYR